MNISFTLTPDLISNLKSLDNRFLDAFTTLKSISEEELNALHRYAKISMIGASTRIENAQLTDSEVNWLDTILAENGKITALDENRRLIEDKLSKDRERSIEEVAGCRTMLNQIYESPLDFFPLKEIDLRGLHYELLSPYKKSLHYAGKYKIQTNSVVEQNKATGESRLVFETAEAGPITSAAMGDLVAWYNETLPLCPWSIAVSCELVYRFLAIHPFQDGNGRLGRGLFLLSLLQSHSQPIAYVSRYLAIDRIIEKHKESYYQVLNKCSNGKFQRDPKNYRIDLFLKFMIKILNESLDGIAVLRKKFTAERNLSANASAILKSFKEYPELKMTTGKIIEATRIPRRTVIYAINSLIDAGLIQRYGQGAGAYYQLMF